MFYKKAVMYLQMASIVCIHIYIGYNYRTFLNVLIEKHYFKLL
ncbi:hypothetical protein MEZE111188_18585 [Mesobacillus zeae]